MFEFQEEADELLQKIIPHLKGFSHLGGSEGVVYFVDDNFVVKKYFGEHIKAASARQSLVNHCSEVNRLNMQGFSVPRIYSVSLPEQGRGNAYLLEERAKGNSLFSLKLNEIEKKISMFKRTKKAKLQQELISLIKSEFLETNEKLESLPESEIEKFILTDYLMTRDYKFGNPDVTSSNVIFDGNHLTHIDSYFDKCDGTFTKTQTPAEDVLRDMVDIMHNNFFVRQNYGKALGQVPEAMKMIEQNNVLAKEVTKRLITQTNKLISPKFDESAGKKELYKLLVNSINNMFDRDGAEMINLIEKE